MKKASISVIVPVYNVRDFLPKCIDSLLSQTFGDFELLLVDDGSTDGSSEICDRYMSEDRRVKVIHKPNGGVSSARNNGLDVAAGEFICFADSDDWVEAGYLSDLMSAMSGDIDFVMSDFIFSAGNYIWRPADNRKPFVSENIGDLFSDRGKLKTCNAPYGKLFRNSIISDNYLRFEEGIHYGEDRLFVFTYLLHVKKVAFTDHLDYVYCRHGGSLTSKIYDFGQESIAYVKSLDIIKSIVSSKPLSTKEKRILYSMVCDFANRCINSLYHNRQNSRKYRLEKLGLIDFSMMAKYMYVENMKDLLIRSLFMTGSPVIYDIARTLF